MDELMRIYLNDHLAMGVAGRELAKRSARNNHDTPVGGALSRVAAGIAEDVETFRAVMRRLGVRTSVVKTGLALVAERVARSKLNGRRGSYSPLSRFEELEILAMGTDGTKQLWTTLRDQAGLAVRLPDVRFRRADRGGCPSTRGGRAVASRRGTEAFAGAPSAGG